MIADVLRDIKESSNTDLYKKYNIIINSDGTVYNKKTGHYYQNLVSWLNELDTKNA